MDVGSGGPAERDIMDYTCAWERAFGLSLRRLPPWIQRRMTLEGPRPAVGTIDIAHLIALSQRIERNSRAQSLLETTKLVRGKVTRLAA